MENQKETPRRIFLQKMLQGIGYTTFGAIAWSTYLDKSQANSFVLRPPGAISEKKFVSTCIRCGMCVEACPFDVITLSTISDDISLGTPFFKPRDNACRLCPDIPCTKTCPSNALDMSKLQKNEKISIDHAKMGIAIINKKTCLAYSGLQCTMCIRACPLADKAIILFNERNPRTDMHAFLKPLVDPDYCTGCGLCEHACPTTKSSINILPLSFFTGDMGSHYIIGWNKSDEKRLDNVSTDVILDRTNRNQKSVMDNVNDVDGILKGLYDD